MAITGVDAYGPYVDTGVSTAVTPRANVEVEVHLATEIDTASSIKPTAIASTHVPHRGQNSPR